MNFVDAHDFSVDPVLRVLDLPPSTYSGWRARRTNPSPRARADGELLRLIDASRAEHPFAASTARRGCGCSCAAAGARRPQTGRADHARARPLGRPPAQGREAPVDPAEPAPHGGAGPARTRLHRDRAQPQWVADLTRILSIEGVFWLASVRDTFSNKVVGWDSGPRATTELVISALDYAIWSRDVRDG